MLSEKKISGPAIFRVLLLGSTTLLASMSLSGAAFAQGAANQPPGIEEQETTGEIIVTARKREESAFDVPAALAVVGPTQLAEQNIGSVEDVGKYVPNLTITRFGVGNTAQAAIFIRGIGLQDHIITTDPGVGVYLDGVYLGRQLGSNLSLVNIERIEVLRGPQGTLYGRNSLGGAVNIVTSSPGGKPNSAIVNLQGGSRGRAAANIYAEFPLAENFDVSVSTYFKRRNGVGDFLLLPEPEARVGEEQEFGGRIKARWEPTDRLAFTFSIDGLQANNGQSPYTTEVNGIGVGAGDNFTIGTPIQNRPNPFAGDFFVLQPGFTGGNIAPFLPAGANGQLFAADRDDSFSTVAGLETTTNSAWGGSLTVDYGITDSISTKLLASYRYSDYSGGLDDDETPFNLSEFPEIGRAEQVSVEWQLNASAGIFDFVGGLYYFFEDGTTDSGPFVFSPFNTPGQIDNFGVPFNLGFPTGLGDFDLNQTTNAYAVYGNIKARLNERLTVGGGLRWSRDSKDANALFPSFPTRTFRSVAFNELTWDVNALLALTDSVNAYAQIQKGYQTGGFPPRPFGGPGQFVSFDEQTAINFESGFKGSAFGGRIQGSIALFWTLYRDLALPFSDTTAGGGFVTIVENAGRSRSRGVELDTKVELFKGFTLATAVGYLDSEITAVDAGVLGIGLGDSPALTPRWTLAITPRYETALGNGGRFIASVNYSYRGDQFGQSVNRESERLNSRGLLGFTVGYTSPDDSWTFNIYGENVTNEVYDQGRLQQTGFVGVVLSNDRSEFGVKLSKKFGG